MVDAGQRRFRLSIGTLMIAVAFCAVLLTPLVWMLHRRELLLNMERMAAENARAQAERALYATQVRSAQAAFIATKLGTTDKPKTGSLWAALSVNHPIFRAGQTKDLRIEFTLVNDGDNVIDPKIAESQIVINGNDSNFPNDARSKALAPGESVQFGFLLGDHFKEPGDYRVSWKGTGFHSPEIVFRIVPEKAR